MTAPLPHPAFCDPAHCRAYAAGMEPYHRSAPVTIPIAMGEVLAVFLTQPANLPEMTAVELVAHQPDSQPAWATEHVHAHLTIGLDPAMALATVLRQLVGVAAA